MVKANRRLQRPSSHTQLVFRVGVWDALWSGISPLFAYLLRDGAILRTDAVVTYCGTAFVVSLAVFQWFQTSSPISRFYSLRDAFGLLKACGLIASLSAVAIFLLTRLDEAPRSIPVLHFMLLTFGLLGGRIFLRLRESRRKSRTPMTTAKIEHVVIIEASRLAWFFTRMVEELAPGGYQIVAILDQRPQLKHRSLNGYPVVGVPADLEKIIADYATHGVRIDKVVVAVQPDELSTVAWHEVSRVCDSLKIGLEILPERLMSKDAIVGDEATIGPQPAKWEASSGAELQLDRPFWKIKRIIDFAVTLILAILISPVALIVCALVLVDVGIPIVFWQQRLGRNGTPLHLYKFRTLQTLFDRATRERREVQQSSRIGRLLQRTRIDELPQLWNVLSGDMSLIGPRPLLPVDQPKDVSLRLAVRPGITGWAQVCGGKLISVEEKNALDEWYIRHTSPFLETIIVLRTIRQFLIGDRRHEEAIAAALAEQPASEIVELTDVPATVKKNTPTGVIEDSERAGAK